jgi:hypothetical protein
MMNSKLFALLLLVSAWPAQGATDNARRESSAGTKPPAPARVDASTARQPAPVATAATHPARPPKRYVPMTEALGGPTWDFAHKGLWVTWPRGGSWFDADGVAQGEKPFASARIDSSNVWVSFNATRLVKLLLADNTGIFVRGLRRTGASAPPKIAALPSPEAAKLAIVTSTGKFELRPVMDAWIDVSTNREMVNLDFWQASGGILTWDFSGVTGTLESATLSVFVKNSYGGPGFDAGLFLLDRPEVLVQPELQHPDRVEQGLANTVARDQDLEKLDAVYFYVEGPEIRQKMSNGWVDNDYGKAAIVDYPAYGLRLLEGSNGPLLATAFHPRLQFLDVPRVDNKKPKSTFKLGQVPEEVYVRYLIEYPADNDPRGLWLGTKLPGASSCYYGQYAWAPSASNPAEKPYLQKPDDCFGFAIDVAPPVPVEDGVLMAWLPYMYDPVDARMTNPNRGATYTTNAAMKPGLLYSVEFRVKENTPDSAAGPWKRDGIFTLWINGVKVYHSEQRVFRLLDFVQILTPFDGVLMHGGVGVPNSRQRWRLGGIVVAKQYIGPPKKIR